MAEQEQRGFRISNPQLAAFVILFAGFAGSLILNNNFQTQTTNKVQKQAVASRNAIVKSGDAIAVQGCNRDFNTISILRAQLKDNLNRIDALVADGTYSHRQGKEAKRSINTLLAKYRLPDCRIADDILTGNPKDKIVVPTPRYPGDGK